MDDNFEELVIDVRATTDGFANDLTRMRSALDTNLVDGFDRAGNVLERNLLGAIRRGSLGFDDLKQAAFSAFDQIAAEALNSGLGSIFGARGGALGGVLSGTIGALFGLPGRATGGPVSPGRGYLVGERGPELFVPTSSGQIAPSAPTTQAAREVRVAIQLGSPADTSAPTALRRSSRQMASAVRRALKEA
jgi:hypothetical protein